MRLSFFTVAFTVLSLTATSAFAHSHIIKMSPAASEMLGASPESITIRFKEAVRPKESFIHVLDKDGNQVNSDVLIASTDEKTLNAPVPELEFGTYTVDWKAVCLRADHEVTTGKYQFTIK